MSMSVSGTADSARADACVITTPLSVEGASVGGGGAQAAFPKAPAGSHWPPWRRLRVPRWCTMLVRVPMCAFPSTQRIGCVSGRFSGSPSANNAAINHDATSRA